MLDSFASLPILPSRLSWSVAEGRCSGWDEGTPFRSESRVSEQSQGQMCAVEACALAPASLVVSGRAAVPGVSAFGGVL